MTRNLVIIGAGMAAGRLVEHVTAAGGWSVTLFNSEPRGTYNRIMLSPVLAGETSFDDIVTHDAAFYEAHGVTCRFGETVTAIDRAARRVHAPSGSVVYDKLVIATGSTPVMLPLPGSDLDGVISYRDLDDTQRMMRLAPGSRAVVIGGGLLGLEAAAGMHARGIDVTVVHLMGHLMERQLDAAAGHLLRQDLTRRGIKVLCSSASQEVCGAGGRVRALRLTSGEELPCDLLVMAVGIRPNTGLGVAAGLQVSRGIEVDATMVTSDPDILAIGECIEHAGQVFGLVAPLYEQAKVAAATLCGTPMEYVPAEPATKLKVTGVDLFSAGDFAEADGREDIVLRNPARGVYKRLVLERDRLIGAVMYGETADSGWFHGLIKEGTDVSAMRDSLIFGPGFQGGHALDPMEAVAASLADQLVSCCNGPHEVQSAFAGLSSVAALDAVGAA